MRYRQVCRAGCYIAVISSSSAWAVSPAEKDSLCGKACRQSFYSLKFADDAANIGFGAQECTSRLCQKSLYLCWDVFCPKEVGLAESKLVNQTCKDFDGSGFPTHRIVDDFTDSDVARLARFNATSPDRGRPVELPVIPTEAFYDLWARTLDAQDYVLSHHYYYGWLMGIFWAAVVTLGIANQAFMAWATPSVLTSIRYNRSCVWIKRKILTPATFGWRCVQDFAGWGTLPPRVQTLTLALFLLMNVVCTVHGYRIFKGHIYYPVPGMQVLRHVSDRTGIISFANFPLIWLFGMRNNIVIWLTGWDLKTYNNFHRWVGRIAALQAVIHSIGYTALVLWQGGWPYLWQMGIMTYWWTGELATIFMCFLVGLSVFWFRRSHYEIFLVVHIVLSILVLLTMFGHVSIFQGKYDPLVWVPVAIWLLDRLARAVRIVTFSPQFWKTRAMVSYNEDAHMVRMVVPVSSKLHSIEPGTFYYLMALNKWNFWESHPFTVASVPGSSHHDRESPSEENLPLMEEDRSSPRPSRGGSEGHQGEMTFLIRPYDSFTSRLKEYAEAEWPKPATVHVAVDGPYGKTLPLDRFDRVLFVVGGSGIAVPLSYLKKLISPSLRLNSIHIYWAVRQSALATDVLEHELRDALDSDRVKVSIYLTELERRTDDGLLDNDHVKWWYKRLNVTEAVDETLHNGEEGTLAVVTSGPPSMADECRRAVAGSMLHSSPCVSYFEESFQW